MAVSEFDSLIRQSQLVLVKVASSATRALHH